MLKIRLILFVLLGFNAYVFSCSPSETTRLLIADLACQDPWVAGDAVYQARAIMGWLKPCDSDNNFGFKNGEIENENGTGETDILVYPNPSQDAFTIDFPFAEVIEIEILDINGKVIQKIAIRETNIFRFEHTLKTGIYLLQITLDQQQPYTQKISVE